MWFHVYTWHILHALFCLLRNARSTHALVRGFSTYLNVCGEVGVGFAYTATTWSTGTREYSYHHPLIFRIHSGPTEQRCVCGQVQDIFISVLATIKIVDLHIPTQANACTYMCHRRTAHRRWSYTETRRLYVRVYIYIGMYIYVELPNFVYIYMS